MKRHLYAIAMTIICLIQFVVISRWSHLAHEWQAMSGKWQGAAEEWKAIAKSTMAITNGAGTGPFALEAIVPVISRSGCHLIYMEWTADELRLQCQGIHPNSQWYTAVRIKVED